MLAAALIALALLSIFAPTAGATYPGRNGDLLVTERLRSHGFSDVSRLLRIDPRSGALTRTDICADSLVFGFVGPKCSDVGPPAASPDGRRVALAANDTTEGPPYDPIPWDPGPWSVRVLPLAAGERSHVVLAGRRLPYESIVRWTPELGFVVLAERRRLVLAGPDGADRGTLVAPASSPDVASDGRLAFVRRGNVYVRGASGKARRLTRRGGAEPSWSPRGRLIAFTRKGAVYTVPARGGRVRRLARGFHPVWSPDGRQIAFFRAVASARYFGRDTTFLFVLDRGTGRARRVSPEVIAMPDDVPPNGLDWQAAP